ncbi:hypothetical protein P691DRAFT_804164 [Macrolepiota fuliginosa MF-IS2]|uniref:Small ribosomal subunit protein mS41 n=1 Tax=Macrolepiota fuliginosa MF-IS2 TaxID=1400762 RepID=A0A9P5XPY3_9AGAR|nr:hypothetical protein P691DRAFT_804164 [Macrolepiota fuliginosa MF-IS2]
MLLAGASFGPRLSTSVPRLTRTIVNRTALRPAPPPRAFPPPPDKPNALPLNISTPQEFLKSIGRSSEGKVEPESWEAFWKTSGHDMRKAGLAVRDRRYILWCMEKYRLGLDPREFAHEPKPKKTVRGYVVSPGTSWPI